mmetsp:Transcript_20349/g.56185  ORF Transcript_20349/g.56185 Transcript_20349/m.56185 type:complete len:250 (+) Transcript_20349:129-878(+)
MSRNYDPTTEEFTAAIESYLAKNKGDWRDIQAALKRDNPTWKVPDRRTTKFVKRAKAGDPIKDQDDEKSVMSTSHGTYSPTTDEFANAVHLAVEKEGTYNWRQIQTTIKSRNPSWKVPYRRVSQFVKAEKAGEKVLEDDDKSVSSFRSRSSTKKVEPEPVPVEPVKKDPTPEAILVKDLNTSWKSAHDKVIAAKAEIGDDASTPMIVAHVKDMEASKDSPVKAVTTEDTEEDTYDDDNDGKKEKGCWCC